MDPNATLQTILDGLDIDDTETVSDSCENLNNWIRSGGFLPRIFDIIAADIQHSAAEYVERGDSLEFRIYIRPSGSIVLNTGDPSYDQNHRGYCGSGSIESPASLDDCRAATVAAFNDAIEFYFCQ